MPPPFAPSSASADTPFEDDGGAKPGDDAVANLIVAQLLYLAQEDPDRDIQMYINSPGGQVDAGLG